MMRVVTIVPWRGGNVQRIRLWNYVRPFWEAFPWPLEVVEDNRPGPFNRSWCINEGATRAWPWDVLLVVDADVLEDKEEQVHQAVELAHSTGRMTVAHTEGRDLSERATRHILMGKGFDWNKGIIKRRPVCLSRVQAHPAGLFTDMGGYDERYRGWGYEDSSFIRAHEALYGDVATVPGCSWHLYHQPSNRIARHTRLYTEGKELSRRYYSAADSNARAVRGILDERGGLAWRPPAGRPPAWRPPSPELIA